ncbi:hypothetical protein ACJX0J_007486, partial [Zea mays]
YVRFECSTMLHTSFNTCLSIGLYSNVLEGGSKQLYSDAATEATGLILSINDEEKYLAEVFDHEGTSTLLHNIVDAKHITDLGSALSAQLEETLDESMFANIGAFLNDENFICGDADGAVKWSLPVEEIFAH